MSVLSPLDGLDFHGSLDIVRDLFYVVCFSLGSVCDVSRADAAGRGPFVRAGRVAARDLTSPRKL